MLCKRAKLAPPLSAIVVSHVFLEQDQRMWADVETELGDSLLWTIIERLKRGVGIAHRGHVSGTHQVLLTSDAAHVSGTENTVLSQGGAHVSGVDNFVVCTGAANVSGVNNILVAASADNTGTGNALYKVSAEHVAMIEDIVYESFDVRHAQLNAKTLLTQIKMPKYAEMRAALLAVKRESLPERASGHVGVAFRNKRGRGADDDVISFNGGTITMSGDAALMRFTADGKEVVFGGRAH